MGRMGRGNATYTHNPGGEKKVSPQDRLEAKGPSVKSVQLCG
jgi:hypothetical protein